MTYYLCTDFFSTARCVYVFQQNAKHAFMQMDYTACMCYSPAGSLLPLLQTDLLRVKVVAWIAAPAASSSACDSGLKRKLYLQLTCYRSSKCIQFNFSALKYPTFLLR